MSNYRIVRNAYPGEYWGEHGGEILQTANEIHHDSWSFRESRHLFTNGLRTRSLCATGGSTEQMWLQAIMFVIFMRQCGGLSTALTYRLGLSETELVGSSILTEALTLLLLFALTRSTRWPTLMFAVALSMLKILRDPWVADQPSTWITFGLFTACAIAVATRGVGRGVMGAPWMFGLVALFVAVESFEIYVLGVWPLFFLVGGALVARWDPRMLAITVVAFVNGLTLVFAFRFNDDPWIDAPNIAILGTGFAAIVAAATVANRCTQSLPRNF